MKKKTVMVINTTNIIKKNNHLSPKESLNSDGQQFYQYQQNKRKLKQWWSTILPISTKQRRLKQWWSTIPPISTKRQLYFSHQMTEHKRYLYNVCRCKVRSRDRHNNVVGLYTIRPTNRIPLLLNNLLEFSGSFYTPVLWCTIVCQHCPRQLK